MADHQSMIAAKQVAEQAKLKEQAKQQETVADLPPAQPVDSSEQMKIITEMLHNKMDQQAKEFMRMLEESRKRDEESRKRDEEDKQRRRGGRRNRDNKHEKDAQHSNRAVAPAAQADKSIAPNKRGSPRLEQESLVSGAAKKKPWADRNSNETINDDDFSELPPAQSVAHQASQSPVKKPVVPRLPFYTQKSQVEKASSIKMNYHPGEIAKDMDVNSLLTIITEYSTANSKDMMVMTIGKIAALGKPIGDCKVQFNTKKPANLNHANNIDVYGKGEVPYPRCVNNIEYATQYVQALAAYATIEHEHSGDQNKYYFIPYVVELENRAGKFLTVIKYRAEFVFIQKRS